MTIRPQVFLLALCVALIPSLGWAQNQPQQQARAAAGTNIALIDVSYVFKNHKAFKDRAELIKKEVKDYDGRLTEQKKGLSDKKNKLSEYKAGTPDYERLEAELAREAANLDVEAGLKRKEILEKEAKVYYDTYIEMIAAVKAFCGPRKIGLVLRFDGEEIDPNDRASVFRGVNRPVVYQDGIDITLDILDIVNAPKQAQRPSNGNRTSNN